MGEYARRHPDGPVWGHGWDESGWPERTGPSTEDLDGGAGGSARLSGPGGRAFRPAATTALRRSAPSLAEAVGFDPQRPLSAEAHHLVRAAAREQLTPQQRHAARVAALDHAAGMGIAAVHECAGPQIGGLLDWQELRALEHGVEVVGYWGEPARDAEHARHLIAETGARGLAGDLFVDGALGSHTAWLHAPYRRRAGYLRQLLPRRRGHHPTCSGLHRGGNPSRASM